MANDNLTPASLRELAAQIKARFAKCEDGEDSERIWPNEGDAWAEAFYQAAYRTEELEADLEKAYVESRKEITRINERATEAEREHRIEMSRDRNRSDFAGERLLRKAAEAKVAALESRLAAAEATLEAILVDDLKHVSIPELYIFLAHYEAWRALKEWEGEK